MRRGMTLWRTLHLITTNVVEQVGRWPDVGVHLLCVHGARLAPFLWEVPTLVFRSGMRGPWTI